MWACLCARLCAPNGIRGVGWVGGWAGNVVYGHTFTHKYVLACSFTVLECLTCNCKTNVGKKRRCADRATRARFARIGRGQAAPTHGGPRSSSPRRSAQTPTPRNPSRSYFLALISFVVLIFLLRFNFRYLVWRCMRTKKARDMRSLEHGASTRSPTLAAASASQSKDGPTAIYPSFAVDEPSIQLTAPTRHWSGCPGPCPETRSRTACRLSAATATPGTLRPAAPPGRCRP